ncbi:MAG TPA: hypothetical protein VFQ53_38170 [Kofleriaceae bacterium]|nr:hypothetical protein [Kofleriaceae bacterium]
MKIHTVIDTRTGEAKVRGRSGRMYSTAEYERALTQDDPESIATRADIDLGIMTDAAAHELLLQEMHDCPECRAAMERGEHPVIHSGADLEAMIAAIPPRERARLERMTKPRRRRWRDQRRRS